MKKKILVIEDDQICANIYRNKLVLDGFEVEVANDGETGLELLKSFRPDAILLDLILPKLPGVDVIKQVRAQAEFKQMPLVIFSNTYLTSIVQEAWKAGATKCLAKASCTPNQVIATLTGLLNGGKADKAPAPASVPAVAAPTPSLQTDEDKYREELRRSFIQNWPTTLTALRAQLQTMAKAENDEARLEQLRQLNRHVHTLTGGSNVVGFLQISQLTEALEALIQELVSKPKQINASTLRTVAAAVDSLSILFNNGKIQSHPSAAKVMVVDDEEFSRRAVTHALDRAKLKSVSVADPLQALQLLHGGKFDLIFLDVDMPNMNGFELCTKIRAQPAYQKTPVVFITGLNDFESRTNSMISGGNDFIAKPFMFIELAVKALIYVLRAQFHGKAKG